MKKCTGMVITALVLVLTAAAVQASDKSWKIEKIGIDFNYGRDSWLPDSLEGDHSNNIVERLSLRAESDSLIPYVLNDSWSKWTLGAELQYSSNKGNERPDNSQDTGFHELGVNFIVKRNFFEKMFYLGALAGMSYVSNFPEFEDRSWNESHRHSDIGRSHYLYTAGALAGKDWQLFKSAWALRTECRLTHTSDPFRSDGGKNFASGVLGVTYNY